MVSTVAFFWLWNNMESIEFLIQRENWGSPEPQEPWANRRDEPAQLNVNPSGQYGDGKNIRQKLFLLQAN